VLYTCDVFCSQSFPVLYTCDVFRGQSFPVLYTCDVFRGQSFPVLYIFSNLFVSLLFHFPCALCFVTIVRMILRMSAHNNNGKATDGTLLWVVFLSLLFYLLSVALEAT